MITINVKERRRWTEIPGSPFPITPRQWHDVCDEYNKRINELGVDALNPHSPTLARSILKDRIPFLDNVQLIQLGNAVCMEWRIKVESKSLSWKRKIDGDNYCVGCNKPLPVGQSMCYLCKHSRRLDDEF